MVEDPEGDRLYGLPLEEFTPARDALAARMKSAGDAGVASEVKALRKPTTPAWAVNQLARRQRPLVEELIAACDRLRNAQQELLGGGSAQGVWEATLAERDIVGRLIHEAERILEGRGYGTTRTMLDRIADTLAAAATDPEARASLRRGVMTAEMRRAGFGDILGGDADIPAPRVKPSPRTAPQRKPSAGRTKAAPAKAGKAAGPTPRQVLDAERDATRLGRAADRAEEDAVRYERAAAKAAEEVAATRKRLEIAEREANRVRGQANAARKEAGGARRGADRAAARLDKLRTSRRG
jgi:hypothetical protein